MGLEIFTGSWFESLRKHNTSCTNVVEIAAIRVVAIDSCTELLVNKRNNIFMNIK